MASLADDTRWLDATAQAELVASGEVSAAELTEAAIERIEGLDGEFNAVNLRFDQLRSERCKRGRQRILKKCFNSSTGVQSSMSREQSTSNLFVIWAARQKLRMFKLRAGRFN